MTDFALDGRMLVGILVVGALLSYLWREFCAWRERRAEDRHIQTLLRLQAERDRDAARPARVINFKRSPGQQSGRVA